jgi:hypothetical protein
MWWDDEPWSDDDAGEDPYYQHAGGVDPWDVALAELNEPEEVTA